MLKAWAEGKSGTGRPKIEWEDYMGQIMGSKGKSLQEMKRILKDKDKFRWWLHTPNAWKGHRGRGKEEEEFQCMLRF